MKTATYFLGIALFLGAIFVSCEGPEGPVGEDGIAVCGECHNSGTSLKTAQLQFNAGAHSIGTYYDRSGECAGCHNHEGFIARLDFKSIKEIYNLTSGTTPIGCRTCHNIHTEYTVEDWSLTNANQVTETIFGSKVNTSGPANYWTSTSLPNMGDANLCVQCHQGRDRGTVPSTTSTDSVTLSSHFGPHYSVQGNIMAALGGIPITGSSSYPNAPNGHANIQEACITCHMHEGNHSLEVNFDACVSCHSSADNAEDMVAELESEIHDLMVELGDALVLEGVMNENADGTYSPKSKKVSAKQARAVYNYMVVYSDHSYGVHNPSYVKALLNNTIASL